MIAQRQTGAESAGSDSGVGVEEELHSLSRYSVILSPCSPCPSLSRKSEIDPGSGNGAGADRLGGGVKVQASEPLLVGLGDDVAMAEGETAGADAEDGNGLHGLRSGAISLKGRRGGLVGEAEAASMSSVASTPTAAGPARCHRPSQQRRGKLVAAGRQG